MNFISFLQLLLRNKKWVIVFPMLVGIAIAFFTRNIPHTYSSEMVIYTGIASGYNIENDMNGKIDYHEANSKFDNLINTITAKETRKEVAIRLLAKIMQQPNQLKDLTNKLKLNQFECLTDPNLLLKVKGIDEESTFQNISNRVSLGNKDAYYQLLYGKLENPFNITTIGNIKAVRIGFSDMVKVEYTSENAYITQKTLELLASVFLQKYKGMRIGEVNNVVKYFEEQTAFAYKKLQDAELNLKNFRTTNKVINFYEQTKYIADRKEDFEQQQTQLQMNLNGSESALKQIEKKLNSRANIQIKSDAVVTAQKELSDHLNRVGINQIKDQNNLNIKDSKTDELKANLKKKVEALYEINNSKEGIPGKDILNQWLELTINVEETGAKLNVLEQNKAEFEKVYDRFAPMGSDLNKLERDVDVSEKEYLNLLHNLNQAKLRERNLVVTENISVTDPPDMPAAPNASKRFILILAGTLSCFILVLVILILREYMDDSVSNPTQFLKKTGIKTATAFPEFSKLENNNQEISDLSYERWMLSLIDLQNQYETEEINALIVPFHKSQTSPDNFLSELESKMLTLGYNWKVNQIGNSHNAAGNSLIYSETAKRELINPKILSSCKVIYLCVNAEQKMDEYQEHLLESWKQLNIPIQCIMFNTRMHHLENFLGEIPKKRSQIRKKVKKIVRRYSK